MRGALLGWLLLKTIPGPIAIPGVSDATTDETSDATPTSPDENACYDLGFVAEESRCGIDITRELVANRLPAIHATPTPQQSHDEPDDE